MKQNLAPWHEGSSLGPNSDGLEALAKLFLVALSAALCCSLIHSPLASYYLHQLWPLNIRRGRHTWTVFPFVTIVLYYYEKSKC